MDLVIEDGSRVDCVYFIMDEKNVKKNVAAPLGLLLLGLGLARAEGGFLKSMPHPRAYGSFARLLGKYVREEKVIPLETAIYKLAGLPAKNLGIRRRGKLGNRLLRRCRHLLIPRPSAIRRPSKSPINTRSA